MTFEIASGEVLDRWADQYGVEPRGPGETDEALRKRILAEIRRRAGAEAPKAMISRKGLDRAIARIIYSLETIREEGYDRAGNPTWYALDRLEAIRQTAQLVIEGNELACVGGAPRADIGVDPEFFDRFISTEVGRD